MASASSNHHSRQVDDATVGGQPSSNSSPAASLSNLTGALSKRFTVRRKVFTIIGLSISFLYPQMLCLTSHVLVFFPCLWAYFL